MNCPPSKRLVASRRRPHIPPRIHRCIIYAHFIMHVRPSRPPADPRIPDHFAALHPRTRNRRERRQVRVPRRNPETVIDHHQPAITRVILSDHYDSVRRRMHGHAIVRRHIHAGMKRAFSAERIQPLTEGIRDMPQHRPSRWSVGRVRKTHRRHQPQSAAIRGDRRRVPFQERVLLHRPVKSIRSRHRIVALVERRRMVAQHAVGHRHFGGQRL